MIAIIDGDEVLYNVALSFQKTQHFVKNGEVKLFNSHSYETAVEYAREEVELDVGSEVIVKPLLHYHLEVDDRISRILLGSKSTDYIICLSGENNFRYDLATLQPYKGNRVNKNPPFHLEKIRSLFKSDYSYELSDRNEADELMVYHSKKHKRSVICSSDKDLRTVQGMNYNIGTRTLKYISPEEARYNFYYQLLIGDSTDNIPSPYMLGPVKAKSCLESIPEGSTELETYNLVKEFYRPFLEAKDAEGNYKTKWYSGQDIDEVLIEVANLLWMEHYPGGESRWEIPNG